VFRILPDGTLEYLRAYDYDTTEAPMLWCGMVTV